MTREELASIGFTDAELTKLYRKFSDISIDLRGVDTTETQRVRRIAYNWVARALLMDGQIAPGNAPPVSSFAIDAPEVHRASRDPD